MFCYRLASRDGRVRRLEVLVRSRCGGHWTSCARLSDVGLLGEDLRQESLETVEASQEATVGPLMHWNRAASPLAERRVRKVDHPDVDARLRVLRQVRRHSPAGPVFVHGDLRNIHRPLPLHQRFSSFLRFQLFVYIIFFSFFNETSNIHQHNHTTNKRRNNKIRTCFSIKMLSFGRLSTVFYSQNNYFKSL